MMHPVDLTPAEVEACAVVAAARDVQPWVLENALYRAKLGETLPPHLGDAVEEVRRLAEGGKVNAT